MADKTPAGAQQDLEKSLRDYQMLQEQIRAYTMQLDQLNIGKADLERAQKEIEAATGKVYINVGGVIVETTKDKAIADIKERSELTTTRVGSATKQLNELRGREKQLKDKLSQGYKPAGT